jgi:hypothetical protein
MEFLLHAIRYNNGGGTACRCRRVIKKAEMMALHSMKPAGCYAVGLRERPVSASEMRLNLPFEPMEATEGASREDFRDSPLQRCVETGKK